MHRLMLQGRNDVIFVNEANAIRKILLINPSEYIVHKLHNGSERFESIYRRPKFDSSGEVPKTMEHLGYGHGAKGKQRWLISQGDV